MFYKISFEKAVDNVERWCKLDENGKVPEYGFTSFANSVKVLESWERQHLSVPTKAGIAKKLLDKMRGVEDEVQ